MPSEKGKVVTKTTLLPLNDNATSKCVDIMFAKFAAIYGNMWRAQFRDDAFLEYAKKEYVEALSNFDSDVLLKAIVKCRNSFEKPPALAQILSVCSLTKNP